MSIQEALIILIEEQPEVFSRQDQQDLAKQAVSWSEEEKELGNQISDWLEARQKLYESALQISKKLRLERLPGDGKSVPKIKPEDYKPMLINAIHRNFSGSTQVQAPSQASN